MLNDYKIRNQHIVYEVIKLFLSVVVLYSAFTFIPEWVNAVEIEQQQKSEALKIRVIANSGTVQDQTSKMQVVETIQSFLEDNPHNQQNEQFFQKVFHSLEQNFPGAEIRMEFGDNLMPPKWQFATFYPQNLNNSVIYIIGSGRGENWFCSVFATVCEPPDKQEKKQTKFVLYEWLKGKKG